MSGGPRHGSTMHGLRDDGPKGLCEEAASDPDFKCTVTPLPLAVFGLVLHAAVTTAKHSRDIF